MNKNDRPGPLGEFGLQRIEIDVPFTIVRKSILPKSDIVEPAKIFQQWIAWRGMITSSPASQRSLNRKEYASLVLAVRTICSGETVRPDRAYCSAIALRALRSPRESG